MKTLLLSLLLAILFNTVCFGQNVKYNNKGVVKEVTFQAIKDNDSIPQNAEEFKVKYLKSEKNDEFKLKPNKHNRKGLKNEHFEQYYKGIKVEYAGYTFHYKNDTMVYAHGNFVAIDDMDIAPILTSIDARNAFAEYKNIPIDSIVNFQSELLIREFSYGNSDSTSIPQLVYKVTIDAEYIVNNEIGYIDANSGKVLETIPRMTGISYDGTFSTRYSGTQTAKTMLSSGMYRLEDDSRAAPIHTKNLNNSTIISNAVEITDNDNNLTSAEHSPDNIDMGLDVHWALQKIYDYFYDNYEI